MAQTVKIRDKKLSKLKDILLKMNKAVIAYSGGVDSTFLLKAARDTLGPLNVLAVTASSESYPAGEREYAEEAAKSFAVRHLVIETKELFNENFAKNPVERCYYCKKELFERLKDIAGEYGFDHVLDGSTMDDLDDMRYGRIAAKEEGVRSPLVEAGLFKAEIRELSKRLGLASWDKPSFACLASRFSYGEEITKDKLETIGMAEEFLRSLGFGQLRVRYHTGNIARVEVPESDIKLFFDDGLRRKVADKLRSLGFVYITVDLAGYRTGSMNEALESKEVKKKP